MSKTYYVCIWCGKQFNDHHSAMTCRESHSVPIQLKVGDSVYICDKKNRHSSVNTSLWWEENALVRYAGMIAKITSVSNYHCLPTAYTLDIDDGKWSWSDKELILVKEE